MGADPTAEDIAAQNPEVTHTPTVTPAAEGSSAARLVNSAAELVQQYRQSGSFPYDGVDPNYGCAYVVNTALDRAGMGVANDFASRVRVVWRENQHPNNPGIGTVDKLLENGWVETSAPPYQAGDIITWNTRGTNVSAQEARGTADESHIGIIMASGNNVMAMSNDSVNHRPRIHPADYCPPVRVLRKSS